MAQGDGTAFEVAGPSDTGPGDNTVSSRNPNAATSILRMLFRSEVDRGRVQEPHFGKPVPVRQCYLCKGLKMDRYNSYRYRYKKNKTGVIGTFSTGVAPFGLLNPDNPDNPDNDFRDPLV